MLSSPRSCSSSIAVTVTSSPRLRATTSWVLSSIRHWAISSSGGRGRRGCWLLRDRAGEHGLEGCLVGTDERRRVGSLAEQVEEGVQLTAGRRQVRAEHKLRLELTEVVVRRGELRGIGVADPRAVR